GAEHPSIANVLTNLAVLHQSKKRFEQAESLLREALRIERLHYALSHPRVAMTYNNLAALAAARKRFAEAESLLQAALDTLKVALPAGHQDLGLVAVNLGEVYRATRQHGKAAPLYREGLKILEKAWGPDDSRLAPKLERYSALMRTMEEFAEAERAQVRLVAIQVRKALR
ncbi:tetratricopeptide repeat protein, partial [Acidobacteria bacterium ACD]|nr:tetratricopeptide repeat protein [Acidobacteria bacterium ACD]